MLATSFRHLRLAEHLTTQQPRGRNSDRATRGHATPQPHVENHKLKLVLSLDLSHPILHTSYILMWYDTIRFRSRVLFSSLTQKNLFSHPQKTRNFSKWFDTAASALGQTSKMFTAVPTAPPCGRTNQSHPGRSSRAPKSQPCEK